MTAIFRVEINLEFWIRNVIGGQVWIIWYEVLWAISCQLSGISYQEVENYQEYSDYNTFLHYLRGSYAQVGRSFQRLHSIIFLFSSKSALFFLFLLLSLPPLPLSELQTQNSKLQTPAAN